MKDLKEKEAPLIFRRLTLEINTSLPYFSRRSRTDLIPNLSNPLFFTFFSPQKLPVSAIFRIFES